tara:strand:- start:1288 stop:1812 length:525 start_codon:yes stop_codon:yes gene_type:complete
MRYLKTILLTFIIVFISTQSKSEIKIAIVEMDTLLRDSLVGKSLQTQLSTIEKNNKKFIEKNKKELNLKKNKINAQKNILSPEEFNKKIVELNKEFESFKINVKKKIQSSQSKRDIAMKKILEKLNLILSEYSNKNKITFIIDQNNIIIGRTDLNVTSEILKLLDQKLTKISLK